ncbi:ACD_00300 [African swine fever virus]
MLRSYHQMLLKKIFKFYSMCNTTKIFLY